MVYWCIKQVVLIYSSISGKIEGNKMLFPIRGIVRDTIYKKIVKSVNTHIRVTWVATKMISIGSAV